MRFQVGDLVTIRSGGFFGVVVETTKANQKSLSCSLHSVNLLKNSPDMYYVFSPDKLDNKPFYTSELQLVERKNGITLS